MAQTEPLSDDTFREQLRRLVQAIQASGQAIFTGSEQDLLQSIVEAAARIFGAAAASIALVDEGQQSLVFQVAYGAGSETLVGRRIPLNQGIAGYVAMTGQPIATSDVLKDKRFSQGFAQTTGYVPRSILATPLVSGERVIGVMEVLDKINAPSFGLQDIELLGIFANQAAMAIHQSQQVQTLSQVWVRRLQELAGGDEAGKTGEVINLLATLTQEDQPEELQALAERIHAISSLGSREMQLCLQVLQAFETYARSRSTYKIDRKKPAG